MSWYAFVADITTYLPLDEESSPGSRRVITTRLMSVEAETQGEAVNRIFENNDFGMWWKVRLHSLFGGEDLVYVRDDDSGRDRIRPMLPVVEHLTPEQVRHERYLLRGLLIDGLSSGEADALEQAVASRYLEVDGRFRDELLSGCPEREVSDGTIWIRAGELR